VKDLRELDLFVEWCQEEDVRLRREAASDPELAALLADADAKYEAQYGKPWVNPKSQAA
jgi:hypothetical protein